MKKQTLARLQAEAMSPEQLAAELQRIDRGLKQAVTVYRKNLLFTRRDVFVKELNRQIGKGESA
jgi:hypothetical protein